MKTASLCATAAIAVLLGAASLLAQDTAPASGSSESEIQGSVTAGYRFTDVSGRKEKYLELFDLKKGFRMTDFELFGRAPEKRNNYFDTYSLTASGLGGDPFPGGQLSVSKQGLYDLRINYRQTHYYWNRNDSQPNPGALNGLSINHDWATVRKLGSMNLTLYGTKNLRFTFEYNRTGREGMTFVTRALDYFGSDTAWGGFARANPYYLQAPVNETANRFAGGVSYSWRDWNLFYRLGYQTFEQNLLLDNVESPERTINTSDPVTANELLNRASFNQFRRLSTPISEFSYVGRARSRLQLRGGYIFYKYSGPVSQNADYNGAARVTTTTFTRYAVSENDRGHVSEPNHVIDQGLTWRITGAWSFLADYRYSRLTEDAVLNADSLRDSTIAVAGEIDSTWRYGLHRLNLALEFAPGRKILVRPGVQLMRRTITVLEDGVPDEVRSKRSDFVAPILSVYYAPSQKLSIRGNIQSITNDTPYTRISPRTDVAERWIARYAVTDRLSIENSAIMRVGKYSATSFRNSLRTNATTLSYALNDRLSLFGGFGYDSFLATASVTFLRGTAPLQATWRDQTINRVWQAGIDARPAKRVSLRLSGNYDRTTGVGEISGEPPLQGPIRFPMMTGTATYDFGKPGRVHLDLQRAYYIEEIMRGDNFNANVLMLRWTKDF
jgi:opacity protein-like surface antigen